MPRKDPPPPEDNLPEDDSVESEKWYTLRDLEDIFKRSKSTINRWRRNHNLVCAKIDGTVVVFKDDLHRFMKDHRKR